MTRDLIADFIDRPDWMLDAACKEHPELDWFPERGTSDAVFAELRAVCAGCLVNRECLSYALDGNEVGVWAGTGGRERQRLRRARRIAA